MPDLLCFTTASNSDLPMARVLAQSLRQFHADWEFAVVLTEPLADRYSSQHETFSIVRHDSLGISELLAWLPLHNKDEARLAFKGPALQHFLGAKRHQAVVYLDVSSVVFQPLAELRRLLNGRSVCLLAERARPAVGRREITEEEIGALRHGSFDMNLFGVSDDDQGRRFAQWWGGRVSEYCFQDDLQGIYFDQKWGNMAPALFDNLHIIRDDLYHVTPRALLGRDVRSDGRGWLLDGRPVKVLRFDPREAVGAPVRGLASQAATQLQEWYRGEVRAHDHDRMSAAAWAFASSAAGAEITDQMRWANRRSGAWRNRQADFDALDPVPDAR